jgi:hypothetical protein
MMYLRQIGTLMMRIMINHQDVGVGNLLPDPAGPILFGKPRNDSSLFSKVEKVKLGMVWDWVSHNTWRVDAS